VRLKGLNILLIILFFTNILFAQKPIWVQIAGDVNTENVKTNAPLTENELVDLFVPKQTDHLIGTRIKMTAEGKVLMNLRSFNNLIDQYLIDNYYKTGNQVLDFGMQHPRNMVSEVSVVYEIADTNRSDNSYPKETPYVFTFSWKDKQTQKEVTAKIEAFVTHYYSKTFLYPKIKIGSKNGKPLKKGNISFERTGPGTKNQKIADVDIENGEVISHNGSALSAGYYKVTLEEPEDCKRVLNNNLIIFPDEEDNNDTFNFFASCEKTYDIYATLDAPNFAKVELVWKNVSIHFPEKAGDIQIFDAAAYENSGGEGQPKDIEGKPLDFPYSFTIPGLGKMTYYGSPENKDSTPELVGVKMYANDMFTSIELNTDTRALNSCEVVRKGNGPVFLNLAFDLKGMFPNGQGEFEQIAGGCRAEGSFGRMIRSTSPYPVNFKQLILTKEDIENLKEHIEFEKTLSNGKGTLLVEFKNTEE